MAARLTVLAFTHSWTPNYSQFRVGGDVQQEIKRTDTQIKALTPWILGAPVPVRVESSGRVDAIAGRAAEGSTCSPSTSGSSRGR